MGRLSELSDEEYYNEPVVEYVAPTPSRISVVSASNEQDYVNPDLIKVAPTYVAPSGILTVAPAPVIAPVTPNLGQYNIYIDQAKLNEQIAYQQQLTLAAEEKARIEQAAIESAARAAALSEENAIAALKYAQELQRAADALKATDNETKMNAMSQILSQINRVADSAQVAAETNPTVENVAAATMVDIIAAEVLVDVKKEEVVYYEKDMTLAENSYIYLKQVAEETKLPEDVTKAVVAEENFNKTVEVVVDVMKEKDVAVNLKNEIVAEAESKAAELKVAETGLEPKTKKLSWLDKIVEVIYNNLYKN